MCTTSDSICRFGDLRRAGMSRRAIDAALRSGALIRIRRGVYARPDACSPRTMASAHGGVLACVSAARHAGLWVLAAADEVHVWMRANGRRRHSDGCGCIPHWDAGAPTGAFAPPSVPRILAQILRCRGVEEFFVVLESARRHRLINARGLRWLADRVGPDGREALRLSRSDADSGLESLFRWRLRHLDVPVRTQLAVFAVGRVDVLIGDRLLVEVDGIENHDDATHRHKDLVRDANAVTWGYVTLRFDYAMVVHDWETVDAAVSGALAARLHVR